MLQRTDAKTDMVASPRISTAADMRSLPDSGGDSGGRRDDVQGLRALAVVLVVLYHADRVLSGGYIGVDVFFVISGFVIMAMMLRERDRTGSLDMKRFYTRRIRRLLPALAVMLTATAIGSALILSPFGAQQTAAETGRAASLFTANAKLFLSPTGYFDASAELNPLLHTWSLAVEEQFYLLFPVAIFVAWQIGKRAPRAAALFVLLLVGLVSFASSVLLVDASDQQSVLSEPREFAFYASPTRAWEFVAGALLAFLTGWTRRLTQAIGHLLSAIGLATIMWCAFVYTDLTPFPGIAAIAPVIGTVLLLVGGGSTVGGITGVLSSRIPVRLGDLSYSWYLWHWPVIVFAGVLFPDLDLAVIVGFGSIGIAWMSYVFVEEWFRNDARWEGWWSVGLATGCILLPIAAMAAVQAGADERWGDDTLDEVAQFTTLHGDVTRGCHANQGTTWEAGGCTWSPEDDASTSQDTATGQRGQILLFGDSHAGHLTEAVTTAGNNLGYDVVVRTWSACPFLQASIRYTNGKSADHCEGYVEQALQQATEDGPELVVISTAIREYLTDGAVAISDVNPLGENSRADHISAWQDGFDPVLKRLDDAGIPVVVVQPLPVFEDWSLLACSMLTISSNPSECGTEAARDELLAGRAVFVEANNASVDRFPAAETLDLFNALCPGQTCVTNEGDTYLYRDGGHITVDRSTRLSVEFTPVLQALLSR